MRARRWLLAVAVGFTLCTSAAAKAQARPAPETMLQVALVRFQGHASPTTWVRYEDHKLWVAPSWEGLYRTKPLRLTESHAYSPEEDDAGDFRERTYAVVTISGPIGPFAAVRLRPLVLSSLDGAVSRGKPDPPSRDETLISQLRFRYRDRAGHTWEYVTHCTGPLTPISKPQDAAVVALAGVPDPKALTLLFRAGPGKRCIYLEVQASAGSQDLFDVRRDGRSLPLRVTITNAAGKAVRTISTTLPTVFPAVKGPAYRLSVPNGRYTVTVSLPRTPFHEPLSFSEEVVVE